MSTAPRYRCPACMTITETDDTMPVCNSTDRCGFLFDEDLVPATPAPARRALRFKLDRPGHYLAGDERAYDVHYRGQVIGTVEPCWLLARTPGDPPPSGWAFVSGDRQHSGEGRTRADAVIAAYTS